MPGDDDLFDPLANLRVGLHIYQREARWAPWTVNEGKGWYGMDEAEERRRNASLRAVNEMLRSERAGGSWPGVGEQGFAECRTVQMMVEGDDVRFDIISADGDLLNVVRLDEHGGLRLDDDRLWESMPAPDPIDDALKVLAEYVTLPYEGRRLVRDAGSRARVRADARNRAMMERVLMAGSTVQTRMADGCGRTLALLTTEEPLRAAAQRIAPAIGVEAAAMNTELLREAIDAAVGKAHELTMAERRQRCDAHGPHGARCVKPAGHEDAEHRDGFGEGSGGWAGDARGVLAYDVERRDRAAGARVRAREASGLDVPARCGAGPDPYTAPDGMPPNALLRGCERQPGHDGPHRVAWPAQFAAGCDFDGGSYAWPPAMARPVHGGYPGQVKPGAPVAVREPVRPDLVSRMLDARESLFAVRNRRGLSSQDARDLAGALRWLDEGLEEGFAERELRAELRRLVEGASHVCTCAQLDGHGCSEAFEDRCRFEEGLRRLLGLGDAG